MQHNTYGSTMGTSCRHGVIRLLILLIFISHTTTGALSCSSSPSGEVNNCTVRAWLAKLKDQAFTLECTATKLQKSITILNETTPSLTSTLVGRRSSQLAKVKSALNLLNLEIQGLQSKCSTFDGPDCDGCSTTLHALGWKGPDCNIPICDSKCLNCSAPGQCSTCKSGWSGLDCSIPMCNSKCLNCSAPGNCSQCLENWNGLDCTIPVCDSKCSQCSSPGNCSVCTGNWNGVTCSMCKLGWNGTNCTIPMCNSKCFKCSSPGNCTVCYGGWSGKDCSTLSFGDMASSTILTTTSMITRFLSEIMNGVPSANGPVLLYRASNYGYKTNAFHTYCDNKGKTIVIIKAGSGAIFGGFSTVSWNFGNSFDSDPTAFLFSVLSSNNQERFTKLTQENGQNYKNEPVKYKHSKYNGYGPSFGNGHDLYISDNCNSNTDSYSDLCADYCDESMTRDLVAQSYLAGSPHFKVVDYEVYSFN